MEDLLTFEIQMVRWSRVGAQSGRVGNISQCSVSLLNLPCEMKERCLSPAGRKASPSSWVPLGRLESLEGGVGGEEEAEFKVTK